jgi:hypothetical protein
METSGSQQRHEFAPGIGQLGEAVQQQDARPVWRLEACFQHVDAEAVDVGHETRPQARRQGFGFQR